MFRQRVRRSLASQPEPILSFGRENSSLGSHFSFIARNVRVFYVLRSKISANKSSDEAVSGGREKGGGAIQSKNLDKDIVFESSKTVPAETEGAVPPLAQPLFR